jgi:hypothetical protein
MATTQYVALLRGINVVMIVTLYGRIRTLINKIFTESLEN